jgi:protein-disulfide isomerase
MADEVDLDMDAFNACFSENRYREEIQADFDYGQEIGVSGTPSVFVNGQKVGEPGKIASFQEIAVAVDAIAGTDE